MAGEVRITFTQTTRVNVGDDARKPGDLYHKGKSYAFKQETADYWVRRGVAVYASEADVPPPSSLSVAGGSSDAGKGEQGDQGGEGPKLDDMTVRQLTELADARKIDLGKATTKTDIIAVIRNAEGRRPGGG